MNMIATSDFQSVKNAALFFSRKEETEMAEAALTLKGFKVSAKVGDVSEAISYLKTNTKPDVLVLEITYEEEVTNTIKRLSQHKHPATKLVVVSEDRGISVYKQALQAGAFEYMPTPLNHDELASVVERENNFERTHTKGGVVVWGLVGGVGASTISSNIASYAANALHRHTLLIDMNLHSGTCGTLLNHHESGQLASLMNYGDDVDSMLLGRSVSKISDHLSLLNDQLELTQNVVLASSNYRSLVESANSEFNAHVWDVSGSALNALPEILSRSKTCVLVTELTIAGVKGLSRSLELLEGYPNVRPIIVINKVRPDSGRLLKIDYVEKTVGKKVDHIIEYSGKSFIACDENGSLLINGSGKVPREIKKLAGNAVGVAEQSSGIKKWFGKR
ncbi:hypothetical protein MADA3029_940110 [Vibrio nigripulchritudo MADA3029]|uniref:MinD/ParA family protein n=1 Tax=Vibrio nigripulchritudo TaxID=28173 RepID=UPI0003B223C5|nr:MinD/ParA family protein [Vibrio nigripulchritudo]CCN50444.1 hypothetical protein VIBNIMADA3020_910108 [Vibrio nigripulchritudo MADA3020]CCN52395.1 hypothetical protein VIBNIMADA3021_1230108 [Vibrio nigripulchritudo MADA3021]CCN62222.1 hypothetical protein MADA3029_940110 [Vibrio nigripulchritudo MADA3029]